MKSLMSIGDRFIGFISPKDLVDMVLKSKYIKGFEAYIRYDDEKELNYLKELLPLLKKHNLILQIHGDVEMGFNLQVEYMKLLEDYSDFLGYPIVVTMHTIYDEDAEISIKKTVEYLGELVKRVDKEKIVICLENLNDLKDKDRLGKMEMRPIVLNDENIWFTYDMGHVIVDYGNLTDLDGYMIEEIRDIHLHTTDKCGLDHSPIYKKDLHWNEIIKGLLFLKKHNYKYNIAFEYDLNYCRGETIKERVQDFIDSIDFVSERIV